MSESSHGFTTDSSPSEQASEVAALATHIADAVGFSFGDVDDERLNGDGAWEYHFESGDRWGVVAAGVDRSVETTYPGWGTVVIGPDSWAVFYEGTLVGMVSVTGGRIGWYAPGGDLDDLESAMHTAFRTERDALASNNWSNSKGADHD
jgi:hypothetical protein